MLTALVSNVIRAIESGKRWSTDAFLEGWLVIQEQGFWGSLGERCELLASCAMRVATIGQLAGR